MAVDEYTKLLLHCDGADGSTTFIDSATGKTITASGNAQIDTAQYKFGGASGLFDGTNDFLYTPNHADFTFGTGDFTIDFWVRLAAINVQYVFYDNRPSSTNGLYISIAILNTNVLFFYTNSAVRITGTTAI